jgi:hypothetical protein
MQSFKTRIDFFAEIRQTPQLFVSSICRKGNKLAFKINYPDNKSGIFFFKEPNRLRIQALERFISKEALCHQIEHLSPKSNALLKIVAKDV